MKNTDIQKQKSEWKRKGWSIPELRGGKQEWFNIVTELHKSKKHLKQKTLHMHFVGNIIV